MRFTQSEKMVIIRMVEESTLSVKQTFREMDVPHSVSRHAIITPHRH